MEAFRQYQGSGLPLSAGVVISSVFMGRRKGERHLRTRVDAVVDVGRALQLRIEQGCTYQEIADIQGTSKQAVHKRLKPFLRLLDDPDAVRAYGKNESMLLDGARMQLLANIVDPERLSKAPVNSLAFAFDKLFNAGRLLRNQSTANIGLRQAIVAEAHRALRMEAHQQLPGGASTKNRSLSHGVPSPVETGR